MNVRIILALLVIVILLGLLMFSPQGKTFKEKYIDKYLSNLGNFLKSAKYRAKAQKAVPNKTFEVMINGKVGLLNGQEFNVDYGNVHGKFKLESASIGDLKIEDMNEIEFTVSDMFGGISIEKNGNIRITGSSSSVELDIGIMKSKVAEDVIDFSFYGKPISFEFTDINKEKMTLNGVTGTLTVKNVPSLSLNEDKLDVINFYGKIESSGDSLKISGDVENIVINEEASLSTVVD